MPRIHTASDGVMTLTIEYATAGVHNTIVCGPVSRESTDQHRPSEITASDRE